MSNKNLKVYRILFFTELGQMKFKVKFPCKLKVVWKRSNQSAETEPVPVENGVVKFNQTIKLYINMYFDTQTNKFVEKKCLYSFLILTQKGQKSAGSVTCDLSELFNKRLYQLKQEFPLQKCPLPDTKIDMKIYYEQSIEQGYDSMSQISTQNLDVSTASVDLSEIVNALTDKNEENKDSDSTSKEEESTQKVLSQSNYDLLNESDLGRTQNIIENEKMSENIHALQQISGKIDEFVTKCSGNIKSEIQNLRFKNTSLQQQLTEEKIKRQKAEQQLSILKSQIATVQKSSKQTIAEYQSSKLALQDKIQSLQDKLKKKNQLCNQLQSSLQQKGESQTSYITNLKSNFQQTQTKLNQKVTELNAQLLEQRKTAIQSQQVNKKLQETVKSLQDKLAQSQGKCIQLNRKQMSRERELSEIRAKFQNVYQRMVKELNNIN